MARNIFHLIKCVSRNTLQRNVFVAASGLPLKTHPHIFHISRAFAAESKVPWTNLKSTTGLVPDTLGQGNVSTQQEHEQDDKSKDQKSRDDAWRKMKWSLFAVFGTLGVCGSAIGFTLGRPKYDEDGNEIKDEFSHLPLISQFFRRMIHEIEGYNTMIKKPSSNKLLPDPPPYPYIYPTYTVVVELTDLLVHPDWTYQTGWRFKKRPGVDKFLEQISHPNFELVVYTAEQPLTAYSILDSLDPEGRISYRLVRDATDFIDGHHVKNLDCLNRDLSKVIVLDWDPNSVKLHRNNTFLIPRWNGNDDDTTLIDVAAFIKTIASNQIADVRDVLAYYREYDNPIEAFRMNQQRLLEQREKEQQMKKRKETQPISRWSPSLLSKK